MSTSASPLPGSPTVPGAGSTATGQIGAMRWWWLFLAAGVAWTLYGMLVLSLRPTTVASLAVLAGIAFIFGGVSQLFTAQRVESWRWLWYVGGGLGIVAGIVAFAWPGKTLLVIAVFVAWYLAIGGIFSVVSALAGPKRDWWWIGLVVGILQFLLGMWAIGSPGRELLLLVNLVGIAMVMYGVTEIFAAFAVRSERKALEEAAALVR
jgi:uncharacterized membrane protein HdeD (DUF308 family)